jgi:predicted nucleic acid-binding protein
MSDLVLVDTNVLLYEHDARDRTKQQRARAWMAHLWTSKRGRISFQVLNEFYVNATQKLKPGLAPKRAREVVKALLAWEPFTFDGPTIEAAWNVQDRYRLSLWDALIVSAAQIGDCRYLLSEDLQHGQDFGGVKVVDPFGVAPDEIS